MCTGIELGILGASLAATAAGTGMGIAGAQQSAKAVDNATLAQLQASQNLQKAATPVYETNLKKTDANSSQAAMQQGQQAALAEYQRVGGEQQNSQTQPTYGEPGEKQAQARNAADISRGAKANAALMKYPAMEQNWQQGNATTANQLGTIAGISALQQQGFPVQLAKAQQAGAQTQGIGSLISAIGQLGGVYGAANMKPATPQPQYVQPGGSFIF